MAPMSEHHKNEAGPNGLTFTQAMLLSLFILAFGIYVAFSRGGPQVGPQQIPRSGYPMRVPDFTKP